jgi:cell wall-associated NlpC family hydrolase
LTQKPRSTARLPPQLKISLAQRAMKAAGVNLPRTTDAQADAGVGVPLNQVQAGDLLFSPGADGATTPGHVVMALGNGWIIEAPRTGLPVHVTRFTPERAASIVAVRRVTSTPIDPDRTIGAHLPPVLP